MYYRAQNLFMRTVCVFICGSPSVNVCFLLVSYDMDVIDNNSIANDRETGNVYNGTGGHPMSVNFQLQ
jgi:hypothetical protein